MNLHATLVLVLLTFMTNLSAQTAWPLSIDGEQVHGELLITNRPNRYGITYYAGNFPGLSFSCEVSLKYTVQSQKSDGTYTEWFQATNEAGIVLKNVDQGGMTVGLPIIVSQLKKFREEFKASYPGLSQTLQVRSIEVKDMKCSTKRSTLLEVCEDYLSVSGLLNKSERAFMETLRKNNSEFAIRDCQLIQNAAEEAEEIDLSAGGITSLELLKHFPRIKVLNLAKNPGIDLKGIRNLEDLISLNVSSSGLTEANAVGALRYLRDLDLSDNNLSAVKFLSVLGDLEKVSLARNKIEDLSPLISASVVSLDVSRNALTDLIFLENKKNLRSLNLSGNKILDFSSLSAFTHLTSLSLEDNLLQARKAFEEKYCPIRSTTYEFYDLDSEVQQILRSNNQTDNPANGEKFTYMVLGTDALSKACDGTARKFDSRYDMFQVIVPPPKPRPIITF